MFILVAFIVIAIVAGWVANYLVGKKRHYEPWELFVIGIVGSFIGGTLFAFLFDGGSFDIRPSGLIGSCIGAVVALVIYGPLRDQLRKRNA
jgi:uncharacterized membrane protein YeaQ/YmgE (transglycosylase-associated protein family)